MKTHQKRILAFILAALSIVLSFALWTWIARSLVAPVAQITWVTADEYAVSSAESGGVHSAPPLAPPGSVGSVSSALRPEQSQSETDHGSAPATADRQREELLQWETHEFSVLSIPSLSIRAPVFLPSRRYWDARDWETLERQMQAGLLYGAVAYPHSVVPGDHGTVIIAGHSSPPGERARESRYGEIFASLPQIAEGERIMLRGAGQTVVYAVTQTMIVPAGDTTVLQQQRSASLLTLITCYPVGSTKERFVVIARRVEQ